MKECPFREDKTCVEERCPLWVEEVCSIKLIAEDLTILCLLLGKNKGIGRIVKDFQRVVKDWKARV